MKLEAPGGEKKHGQWFRNDESCPKLQAVRLLRENLNVTKGEQVRRVGRRGGPSFRVTGAKTLRYQSVEMNVSFTSQGYQGTSSLKESGEGFGLGSNVEGATESNGDGATCTEAGESTRKRVVGIFKLPLTLTG